MNENTTTEVTTSEVNGRTLTTTVTTTVTVIEYPATVEGERARLKDALMAEVDQYRQTHRVEYSEALRIITRVFDAAAA